MSTEVVATKARRILTGLFGDESAARLIEVMRRLGDGASLSELSSALRESPQDPMPPDVD